MITIFNRRELAVTTAMNEQERIRQILASRNVEFCMKTANRMSPSPFAAGTRSRTGTLGQSLPDMITYIIYVRKKDYEQAVYLIR